VSETQSPDTSGPQSPGAGAPEAPGAPRAAAAVRARLGRRLLGLAGIGAGLGVALLIAAAVFAARSGLLSERAVSFASRRLGEASNLRLRARSVERMAAGVRLIEPLVEVSDSSRWYPLVRARKAEIRVSFLDLLQGRPQVYELRLERPVLELHYTAAGRAVLPVLRTRGPARPGRDGVRVTLERARFVVRGPGQATEWWGNGRLRASVLPEGRGHALVLEHASGSLPTLGLVVQQATGRGHLESGEWRWRELSATTDAGRVRAEGGWRGRDLDVRFAAAGWPWEFFGELLEQPALDVPGYLDVHGSVAGTFDRPAFRAAADGRWRDEPFRATLDGEVTADGLALSRARIEWQETSLAGSARFRNGGQWWIEGDLAALDLARLSRIWPGLDLPATRLSGPARLEGGSGRIGLLSRGVGGEAWGLPVEGIAGSWEIDGRTQSFSVSAGVAGGSVAMTGGKRGEEVDLAAAIDGVDVARLGRLDPRLAKASGRLRDAAVRLVGPTGRRRLTVRAGVDAPAYGGARARSLDAQVEGWLGPGGRVEVRAVARGLEAAGQRADSAWVAGTCESGICRWPVVRAVRADTSLTLAVTARSGADGWRVSAFPARLETADWTMAAEEPLVVRLHGGQAHLDSVRFAGGLGRFELSGWIRSGEDLDLRLRGAEMDLGALASAAGLAGVSGDLSADAHLTAGRGWKALVVQAGSRQILAPSVRIEGLAAAASLRAGDEELRVEQLEVTAGDGTLRASGRARLEGSWPLAPTGWAKGLRGAREWRGDLRATNFDLGLLAGVWPQARGLAGRFTGEAHLGGDPQDPSGGSEGAIDGLGLAGYRFDAVRWHATYGSRELKVEHAELREGELESRVTGTLPLDLAWGTPGEKRFPDSPMDLRLSVADGSLAALPLFLPIVAAADGRLQAEVRLTGTPAKPRAVGTASVRDGHLRFTGREELYYGVTLQAVLRDDRIFLEDARARQGKEGVLEGKGTVTLADGRIAGYDLAVRAERATALASGEYSLEFDGEFHVTDGPRLGRAFLPIPHVRGTLRARQGTVLYDFADPGNRVYFAGPVKDRSWIYDVEVKADNRVFWRTPNANIEMKFDLSVSQTLDALRVWGTIESVRGDYYFLENKFRVEEGVLSFDEVEPLNPRVQAKAQTAVNLAGGAGALQRETIDLTLAERLRKPEVTLTSSSGLSETQIIQLLTYGRFGLDRRNPDPLGRPDQRLIVGTMGGQYLVRQLARQFPEASSLLNEVELGTAVVEDEAGGRLVPRVGVSRYLTSDLRLRYSQLLSEGSTGVTGGYSVDFRDVGAEYRISKVFILTGQVVERRKGSALTPGASRSELQYNVDLGARHEW